MSIKRFRSTILGGIVILGFTSSGWTQEIKTAKDLVSGYSQPQNTKAFQRAYDRLFEARIKYCVDSDGESFEKQVLATAQSAAMAQLPLEEFIQKAVATVPGCSLRVCPSNHITYRSEDNGREFVVTETGRGKRKVSFGKGYLTLEMIVLKGTIGGRTLYVHDESTLENTSGQSAGTKGPSMASEQLDAGPYSINWNSWDENFVKGRASFQAFNEQMEGSWIQSECRGGAQCPPNWSGSCDGPSSQPTEVSEKLASDEPVTVLSAPSTGGSSGSANAPVAKQIDELSQIASLGYLLCHTKSEIAGKKLQLFGKNSLEGQKAVAEIKTCSDELMKSVDDALRPLKAAVASKPKAEEALKDFYSTWRTEIRNVGTMPTNPNRVIPILKQKLETVSTEYEW